MLALLKSSAVENDSDSAMSIVPNRPAWSARAPS